jgi:hypothetical protein
MLCRMCLEAEATIHMLDRPSAEKVVEADYCPKCYDVKYVNPPDRPPAFPRPRFTIKNLMIFAGLFAIPNAAAALIMRSSLITGTPAQIREWTLQAFLFVNIYCGAMAAFGLSLNWLQRAQWHKMTGGLVPMTQPRKLSLKEYFKLFLILLPIICWYLAGLFLIDWLTPMLWPSRRPDPALSTLIISAPLLAWACLRMKSNRHLVERVSAMWRGADRRERLFRILALSWPLVIGILLISNWRNFLNGNWMFLLCAAIVLIGGGKLILFSSVIAVTRRR